MTHPWSERRSFPSKVYRALVSTRNAKRLIVLGASAWTLVIAAMPAPAPTDLEAATYWRFFVATIAAVVGLVTILGAGMALGSRWVADPAARRVVADHEKRGAAAHEALVARVEWDLKHTKLDEKLEGIRDELTKLTTRVDTKATSRTRK